MKFISFFAGIGGFDLGLERAGHECVGQVEIDDFCIKVLTKHWPNVPKWRDIRELTGRELPEADLWCGGFPCQDISPASSTGTGLSGERSGLWWDFWRVVLARKPRWLLLENHAFLLRRGIDTIMRLLSESGYDAEWEVLRANEFGAPHRRERCFVIAYSHEVYGQEGMGAKSLRKATVFAGHPRERFRFWLQAPSRDSGMDDGVPAETYRNRVGSYGNAVVPQVAEYIGKLLTKETA